MKKLLLILFVVLNTIVYSQNDNAISGFWTITQQNNNGLFIVNNLGKEYLIKMGAYVFENSDGDFKVKDRTKSLSQTNEGSFGFFNSRGPAMFSFSKPDMISPNKRGDFVIVNWDKKFVSSSTWHQATAYAMKLNNILNTNKEYYFKLDIAPNRGCSINTSFELLVDGSYITDFSGRRAQFIEGNTIIGKAKQLTIILKKGTCPNRKYITGSLSIYE